MVELNAYQPPKLEPTPYLCHEKSSSNTFSFERSSILINLNCEKKNSNLSDRESALNLINIITPPIASAEGSEFFWLWTQLTTILFHVRDRDRIHFNYNFVVFLVAKRLVSHFGQLAL